MLSLTFHDLRDKWYTLQKAYVCTLCDNASLSFEAIKKQTGIPKTTAKQIVKAFSSRHNIYNLEWEETRGRKSLLSPKNFYRCERILEDNRIERKMLG